MGKASKWFRGLLGLTKPDSPSSTAAPPPSKPPKEKRRWSFVKSYRENNKDHQHHHASSHPSGPVKGPAVPNNHAAAVAAATTAVAEAAVAAAHVTAAVARLRTSDRSAIVVREEWAAIKIQAAFRGCLARRALRALKGLVKLQALVRGHIERKRTAEWLQRLQALLQANARVRAGRAQILQSAKFSTGHLHGPTTPDKFESPVRSASMKYDQSSSALKRNSSKSRFQIGNPAKCENRSDIGADERSSWNQRRSWTRACSMEDEKSVMILGIDSQKPHMGSKRRNLFYSSSQPLVSDHYSYSFTTTKDSTSFQSGQSPSSGEVQSYNSPLKINEVEDSPQILSASSKDISPFTPTKSDDSRSYLSSYSDYPNYMAYTESSKAKVRSLSAPKLRPQYERSTSFNRCLLHGFGESRLATQRVSALRASFTSKAYPGSGHLDNLGLPVGYRY